MRTVAFVQARMGSTRLPGKSLLPIWREMPLLELVLRRVRAARALDGVVLLTSVHARDDRLAELATGCELRAFRGEEADVLARFAAALDAHPADAVVRVCADNPFVDPSAIDDLVWHFQAVAPCDYASNIDPPSGLPDGAGAEIVTADALRRAAAEARDAGDREHVTAYIRTGHGAFRTSVAPPPAPAWPRLKLDVDTAEDYDAMRVLASRLPSTDAPLWPLSRIVAAHREGLAAGT